MKYTVYKVTNKINGKFYIGTHKTKDLDDGYMGSGKYLRRAIQIRGIENFQKEILFVFDNPEEMFAKEAELVDERFLVEENTYNLKVGGLGGFDHLNTGEGLLRRVKSPNFKNWAVSGSEASQRRYKESSELQNQRKTLIDEGLQKFRSKYREIHGFSFSPTRGKKHSAESKLKIGQANSISLLGERNPMFGLRWITDGVSSKTIRKTEQIPPGWRAGRNKNRCEDSGHLGVSSLRIQN